jgi:hypothetical protein
MLDAVTDLVGTSKGLRQCPECAMPFVRLDNAGVGRVPIRVEKETWRILPVVEVHYQPAALAGGHRMNATWARVSGKLRARRSLSPSL